MYIKNFYSFVTESQFKMKGKNLNIFVRFGGTNIKSQKGFKSTSYHSPPAAKGIYYMPLVAQEFFLIGSLGKYQKGTMPKYPINHEDWTEEDWDNHHKRYKKALSVKRKQFIKKEGNIWHHLIEYTDRNEIMAEHGSWCKTTIKAWEKAFSRMSLNLRYNTDDKCSEPIKNINNTKGILGNYSKDHCEVFFDEKV